jgi:dihydropteroate synthase
MGVINTTPDSFSDGGSFDTLEKARRRAFEMATAGVDIIDIGGESTRPGAEPLPLEEELRRTVPLIESLVGELEVPISIDTCKSEVADRALSAGAVIINDITALRFDDKLAPLAAERGVPVILMHMQGEPRNMQENPQYEDVVGDISRFLRERAAAAVEVGISPEKLLVDPGIGFGKTVEHNLEILRRIEEFRGLGYPLVLGTSRKRFIGSVLGRPVDQRLLGTASTVAFAISRGVDVVRVHDVEEMMEVVKMADAAAGKHREWESERT